MLSRLPVRTRAGFQGVDWEVETEKSQQGLERRKKARQQRSAQRKERKMSDSQLLSFLRFVIEGESGQSAVTMDACDDMLRRVNAKGFGDFQDGLTNEKVEQLLEMFDSLKTDGELRPLILSWMNAAVSAKLYTPWDAETSQASQIRAIDLDMDKVKEFGQVTAFLKNEEIEKQLEVLNFPWDGKWETAQLHVNEIIKKLET
jgi:hypothetical protein